MSNTASPPGPTQLIGEAPEVNVPVGGIDTLALLDTGSQISTLSESLCAQLGLEIKPIERLLKVEGAAGQIVKYKGYVDVFLEFPNWSEANNQALLLVVSDTPYTHKVPIIVGTNFLSPVLQRCSTSKDCPVEWRMVEMSLKSSENSNFSALLQTTRSIVLPPKSGKIVSGLVKCRVRSQSMNVLALSPEAHSLPGNIQVTPAIYSLNKASRRLNIELQNPYDQEVIIPARTKLCTLEEAKVIPPTNHYVEEELDTSDDDNSPTAQMRNATIPDIPLSDVLDVKSLADEVDMSNEQYSRTEKYSTALNQGSSAVTLTWVIVPRSNTPSSLKMILHSEKHIVVFLQQCMKKFVPISKKCLLLMLLEFPKVLAIPLSC